MRARADDSLRDAGHRGGRSKQRPYEGDKAGPSQNALRIDARNASRVVEEEHKVEVHVSLVAAVEKCGDGVVGGEAGVGGDGLGRDEKNNGSLIPLKKGWQRTPPA
ncbi:MAG TPA: hypothetical protein VGR81_08340 [Candidatus Acidoferrales bacterium]|nr:hypothetical protein [Candidatus Acidoferrales bacterium]